VYGLRIFLVLLEFEVERVFFLLFYFLKNSYQEIIFLEIVFLINFPIKIIMRGEFGSLLSEVNKILHKKSTLFLLNILM